MTEQGFPNSLPTDVEDRRRNAIKARIAMGEAAIDRRRRPTKSLDPSISPICEPSPSPQVEASNLGTDRRNALNDLSAKEWIPETVSVWVQRGLGKNHDHAQIEK